MEKREFQKDFNIADYSKVNFKILKEVIKKNFLKKKIFTDKHPQGIVFQKLSELETYLGLTYKSSELYAGQWICNVKLYQNSKMNYYYTVLIMSVNYVPYAILRNEKGVEKCIKVFAYHSSSTTTTIIDDGKYHPVLFGGWIERK